MSCLVVSTLILNHRSPSVAQLRYPTMALYILPPGTHDQHTTTLHQRTVCSAYPQCLATELLQLPESANMMTIVAAKRPRNCDSLSSTDQCQSVTSKSTKRVLTDLRLTSEPVKVIVGSSKTTYFVNEAHLRASSGFFDNIFEAD